MGLGRSGDLRALLAAGLRGLGGAGGHDTALFPPGAAVRNPLASAHPQPVAGGAASLQPAPSFPSVLGAPKQPPLRRRLGAGGGKRRLGKAGRLRGAPSARRRLAVHPVQRLLSRLGEAAMPGISIVIACRDEADTLWFTLHSLQMHTRGSLVGRDGMEIVVADNDPGAKTCGLTVQEVCAAFAKARFPVRHLAAGEVKSVFYPRNQGAAAAAGEHLIFLDSHVLLTPYTIEALHRLFLNRS